MHTIQKYCSIFANLLAAGYSSRILYFGGLLAFIICLSLNSTTYAKVKISRPKQTIYLRSQDGSLDQPEVLSYIELSEGDSILESSIRSNNETVTGCINCYKPENMDSVYLGFYPKSPGSAKISFEDQAGGTHTVMFKILPYENPMKSLKITNINKGKNLAGKINSSREYTKKQLTISQKTDDLKIKVESNPSWEIISMSVIVQEEKYRYMSFDFTNINNPSKTISLKEEQKKNKKCFTKMQIDFYFKNTKNGAYQKIIFGKELYWREFWS